jgi:maltooligosyltrehalose trehalohydrolase
MKHRFALWAPAQSAVSLELEDAGRPSGRPQPVALKGDPRGWFEVELDCAVGARYRFALGTGERVPDPASRFQPDDVHGASELIDHSRYRWQHAGWRGRPWHETVIYELHVGACGGFRGVRERLAYLKSLGVTAIEMMPIADFSGQRNWGYDGVLPYAPDSAYGRPDDLKALVDAAHGEGLQVFLDVVYNHFGPDGNVLQLYAPAFFRDDVQTPWGAAIDFRQSEVREFFIGSALSWLDDYRVDGLRLDAVHAIHSDDFLPELARRLRDATRGRHVHLMLENEHDERDLLGEGRFDAQWNEHFHNALHVLLTGEQEGYYAQYADEPAARLARALEPDRYVAFLQNHDQVGNRAFGERLTRLADPRALRAATVLLLLSPQIPLLFMGEEWGSSAPFLYFTDFHDALADAVREGRRKEFAKFAAFADPTQRATIPDPNDPQTFARSQPDFSEREQDAHAQWLALYRELLAIRHRELVPRLPGARKGEASVIGPLAVSARWQLGDGARLHLAANFGALPAALMPLQAPVLFESADTVGPALRTGVLPAFSACALLEAG